jgi:hypothetical protein
MSNQVLNKDEIYFKTKMIDYIIKKNNDVILVSEFSFNYQKRRADILLIENDLTHAIEIKSDVDNIYKLNSQIDDYLKSFNKVSIFISTKHIKALKSVHKNVGIFLFDENEIICKRKPKIRKQLDKKIILDFLSTSELKEHSNYKGNNASRVDLISEIEERVNFKNIKNISIKSLKEKITSTFKLFINERMNKTTIHDLSILEIRNTLL